MDAVDFAEIIKSITSIAAGGWAGWIATAVLLLLLGGFWIWLKKASIEAAKRESDRIGEQTESQTRTDGQAAEDAAEDARNQTDVIREQNPDTDKKPRP